MLELTSTFTFGNFLCGQKANFKWRSYQADMLLAYQNLSRISVWSKISDNCVTEKNITLGKNHIMVLDGMLKISEYEVGIIAMLLRWN